MEKELLVSAGDEEEAGEKTQTLQNALTRTDKGREGVHVAGEKVNPQTRAAFESPEDKKNRRVLYPARGGTGKKLFAEREGLHGGKTHPTLIRGEGRKGCWTF